MNWVLDIGKMMMPERFALLKPLLVGAIPVVFTIFTHGLAVMSTLGFIRREKRLGREGVSFRNDFLMVMLTMTFTMAAHLIEIAWWAILFIFCGEFREFGTAYYHSAVNYTTLGYGDLLMTPAWRLLGPLEAANGMLMFGVSTAMIFAVMQRLIQARFTDLRD